MGPDRCQLRYRHWFANTVFAISTILACLFPASAYPAPDGETACASAGAPITLDGRNTSYFPGVYASVAEVPPGTDGFSAMRDGRATLLPNCRRHLSAEHSGADIWLTFSVASAHSIGTNWVISANEPQIAQITLMEALPDGTVRIKRNGATVPDAERDMALRRTVIGLAPASEGTTRYYLRISPGVAPSATLQLQPIITYQAEETSYLIAAYSFIGFLAAIALYNLNLFFNLRIQAARFYVLYVAGIILDTISYEGLVLWMMPWAWSRTALDHAQELSGLAAGLSLIEYCRRMLVSEVSSPSTDRITKGLMVLLVALFVLQLVNPPPLSWLLHISYIVGTVVLCAMFCRRAAHGDRTARLVSFSFMSLFLGLGAHTVLYHLSPGVEAVTETTWSSGLWALDGVFYLGFAGEAILMSMAMMAFVSERRLESPPNNGGIDAKLEDRNRRFIAALDAAIDQNISDHNLGVGALASHMATSERTLRRRLHDIKGTTPAGYIRARRLERARALIEADAYGTVAEVAHAVGLAHAGHFARLYREMFGSTPRDDLRMAAQANTE